MIFVFNLEKAPFFQTQTLVMLENLVEIKSLAIALSGVGRLRWGDGRGNLTNVQYKPIWNCHNESPLYNEYILIKKKRNPC
jgi:hypothetical protein